MKSVLEKRDVFFLLLQLFMFWNFCHGYIRLCERSLNGTTVPAEIGGSASVEICACSDTSVYQHIHINHPSHRRDWVPKKSGTVDLKVVPRDSCATLSITIKNIEEDDIDVVFSVNVYTDQRDPMKNTLIEFIVVTFVLEQQQNIKTTSVMKEDTESITDITQTDDISATTMTPTSICQPQTKLGCPENWLPVKDMCLRVIPREDVCYGAELPDETVASYLTSCLSYLLENTSSTVILLKGSKYFDVMANSTTDQWWNYQKVCATAPPNITEFSLETADHPNKRWTLRRDLMNEELPYIILEPTENFLSFTCASNGIREPYVEIRLDNVTLHQSPGRLYIIRHSSGRVTVVINQVTCQDSGVYTCHARNSLATTHIQKKIEVKRPDKTVSFTTEMRNNIHRDNQVRMICTTTQCPEPNTLTVTDDIEEIKTKSFLSNSLVYEIRNVNCSDMGTYFCRAENQDGQIHEATTDLGVTDCAVQLCRGEDKSKVICAGIGQTMNISVCVMSSYQQPSWKNIYYYRSISVTFTPRQDGSLYHTANILFYNIQERDLGTKIIRMENGYGHLDYKVTVSFDGQTVPPKESPSRNPQNMEVIIRVLGITAGCVLVVIIVIGFLVHFYRMKLLRRSRQLVTEKKAEGRSRHNKIPLPPPAKDQTENISGSGYENISREEPTCPVDLNPPYSHCEEIRDVETGL